MCKYTHKPGRKLKSSVTFTSLSKLKHSAETAVFLRHLQQGHLGFHEFSWLTLPSQETLPLTWPCHSTRTSSRALLRRAEKLTDTRARTCVRVSLSEGQQGISKLGDCSQSNLRIALSQSRTHSRTKQRKEIV